MEGDSAVGVDDLLEFVDDAVAVGGHLGIGEPGHPLGVGFLVAGANLINDFLLDAASIGRRSGGSDAGADGIDDGAEGQLGVGEHGELDLVGLVEVGLVGVDVDDADALGDGATVGAVGLAEGIADGEDDIGFAVYVKRSAGGVAGAGIDAAAEGEGMIFRGICPCP